LPKKLAHLAAPLATALLLVGMTTADKLRVDPHEADAFHARAASVVAALPRVIGSGRATWYGGKDHPLANDAGEMLKPNAFLDRVYSNLSTGRRVEMLLVQCRYTRDMQGHYPPICYPSGGCAIDRGSPQMWHVGPRLAIDGTEYVITRPGGERQTIRNFFVLPSGRIVRDMESVNAAAKDYREVVYGVAQVQLLFDASVGGAERDEIFAELIGPNEGLVDALRSSDDLNGQDQRHAR
jgi:hypothetical protein